MRAPNTVSSPMDRCSCGAASSAAGTCARCGRFPHEPRLAGRSAPRPPRRYSRIPLIVAVGLLGAAILRAGADPVLAWDQMPRLESKPVGDAYALAALRPGKWAQVPFRVKADHIHVVWADGINEKLPDQLAEGVLAIGRLRNGRYTISSPGGATGDGLLADLVDLGLNSLGSDPELPRALSSALSRLGDVRIRYGEANGIAIDDRARMMMPGGRGRGWAGYRVQRSHAGQVWVELLGEAAFELDPSKWPIGPRIAIARLGTISLVECKTRFQLRLVINGGKAGLPAWLAGEIEFRAEGRKGRRAFRASGVLLVRTRDWIRQKSRRQW